MEVYGFYAIGKSLFNAYVVVKHANACFLFLFLVLKPMGLQMSIIYRFKKYLKAANVVWLAMII